MSRADSYIPNQFIQKSRIIDGKEYPIPEPIPDLYNRLGYIYDKGKKEYLIQGKVKLKVNSYRLKKNYKCEKVLAYDTETYKGTCKLICRNEGKKKELLDGSFDDSLEFLFYLADNPNVYRFFYNIDFDIQAILKLWNDVKKIDELSQGITIEYKHWKLTWLRGRMFILHNVKRRRSVKFTDLHNFFKLGLDKEAKTYVKDCKFGNIDGNLLNTSLEYWNDNLDNIIEYCIQDCIITAKLGKVLIEGIENCGLSLPKWLVSSASLSKQFFRLTSYIPRLSYIPEKILNIAYKCYHGGRFEMGLRGSFEQLYLYDINSQYPTFIRKLPDMRNGLWKSVNKLPKNECIGYFYVKVNIPKDYKFPTIPVKHNGTIKFPTGYFEGWFTWYDLDLIREYLIDYKEGYIFKKCSNNYNLFKKGIDTLYEKKNEYKGKNLLYYNLTKLTMNALYGCFVEVNEKNFSDKPKELQAGTLFNSVYASQITAFGRWSVLKPIPKDQYNHIVAIHTDSVITDIPLVCLPCSKELGDWNLECSGKGFIINTGMYQIDNIVKTRGIPKRFINDWFDFAKNNKNKKEIKFEITRMRKIREGLIRDKSLVNVNTITIAKKTVNINSDYKRDWIYDFKDFKDVLSCNIDSLPYYSFDDGSNDNLYPNPICIYVRNEHLFT